MPTSPAATVAAHLSARAGLHGLRLQRRLPGGSNDTWLATFQHELLVVKVFTGTWEDPADACEQEAASLAQWSATGVVPELVAAGKDPMPYVATRFVEGVPVTNDAATHTVAVTAAAVRLHAVSPGGRRWAAAAAWLARADSSPPG